MTPPRPLRWLFGRLAPAACRDTFLDDMDELFTRRVLDAGTPRAIAWYCHQLFASALPFLRMRLRARPPSHRPFSETRSLVRFDTLLQDLRYTLRLLWRSPTFALTSILTIALGIGANTAIFTIVHGLLMKPLPYPNPTTLVTVWQDMRARGGPADEWATPGNLADWRREDSVFAAMASMRGFAPTLTGEGDPESLRGEQVSGAYFDVLQVRPAIGRTFQPDDAVPNAPRVVVLGHGLWQRRFGGDTHVLGRRMVLAGEPHEIIGVMPEGFRPAFLSGAELWRPDRLNLANPSRGAVVLRIVARLKPGVDAERAASAMAAVAKRLETQLPESNKDAGITVVPMHEFVVGNVRPGLLTLFGAVLLVLLVACVNIASLQLARASSRTREIAVRSALGAERRRVVRQLLTESLVLAAIGSVAGVILSRWAVSAVVALAPAGTPRLAEVGIDGVVLAFAVLLTLATGVLFGLAPAAQLSRLSLTPALMHGSRGTAGTQGHRLRRLLIVAEIAMALVLLIGGGLLLRSFLELRRADLGFNPERVVTGVVIPPASRDPTEAHRQALMARVLERTAALPGVTQSAATSIVPLNGGDSDMSFTAEGLPPAQTPADEPVSWYRLVSANYLDVIGIPLRSGRAFRASEAEPVVIVNETLAHRYWSGGDVVGRRVRFGADGSPWFTVIGVVGDVKQQGARSDPRLQMFIPYWQIPELGGGMNIVLKTSIAPESVFQPLRDAVREVDHDIPVSGVTTMTTRIASSLDEPRFLASMVAVFAALAVIVAAIGVYGLMSWVVTERRAEIGVRLALGARRGEIFSLVLRDGIWLAGLGVAIGAAGALLVTPALGRLLFGIQPIDVTTFASTAVILVAIALVATAIPARRATRVDPLVALRGE